jgi:PleD family two-component response regulator
VTMSFGVAGTSDMSQAGGLLDAADAALGRAKKSGKNRVKSAE